VPGLVFEQGQHQKLRAAFLPFMIGGIKSTRAGPLYGTHQ
jgi:hypothetical protein